MVDHQLGRSLLARWSSSLPAVTFLASAVISCVLAWCLDRLMRSSFAAAWEQQAAEQQAAGSSGSGCDEPSSSPCESPNAPPQQPAADAATAGSATPAAASSSLPEAPASSSTPAPAMMMQAEPTAEDVPNSANSSLPAGSSRPTARPSVLFQHKAPAVRRVMVCVKVGAEQHA